MASYRRPSLPEQGDTGKLLHDTQEYAGLRALSTNPTRDRLRCELEQVSYLHVLNPFGTNRPGQTAFFLPPLPLPPVLPGLASFSQGELTCLLQCALVSFVGEEFNQRHLFHGTSPTPTERSNNTIFDL